MRSRTNRRFVLQVDYLEGRKAPSGGLRHGLHDAGDDNLPRHSGQDEVASHNAGDDNQARHGGKDERPGHEAGDDNHRNRHGGR
jgi:hypothetical protein